VSTSATEEMARPWRCDQYGCAQHAAGVARLDFNWFFIYPRRPDRIRPYKPALHGTATSVPRPYTQDGSDERLPHGGTRPLHDELGAEAKLLTI